MRHPRTTTPAAAVEAASDTERRSAEMAAHLSEMTVAVTQAGQLYQNLGLAIATGPAPTSADVRTAHSAGLFAERAVRRFQRSFHDWLHSLDRASRVGVALHATPATKPASPLH